MKGPMKSRLSVLAIVAVAGFIIYALGWGVAYIRGWLFFWFFIGLAFAFSFALQVHTEAARR